MNYKKETHKAIVKTITNNHEDEIKWLNKETKYILKWEIEYCESRYINHFHIHSYDVILNRIMGGILNLMK